MLNDEQKAAYAENGYVLVNVLTPEEAKDLRDECHELARRLSLAGKDDPTWGSARELDAASNGTALMHCPDVQFQSAAFGKLLFDERFTSVAASVLGTPNVQLHHTKMFIKPPEKGSPFPLHQDYPFFPHSKHSVAAAIFHFDDTPEEKGCVRVMPGSHRLGPLEHIQEGAFHLPVDQYPIEDAIPCPAKAGDVLFFNYLTVHGSGVNVTDSPRTTILVQFRDPEDLPTQAVHLSRAQGLMLRGVDPIAAARDAATD